MKCPECNNEMEPGFMYVRGLGGSLFWSKSKDASFFSRKGLDLIDLSRISVIGTGKQAIVPGFRCDFCKMAAFKSE